jgi:hypothetical protein
MNHPWPTIPPKPPTPPLAELVAAALARHEQRCAS